MQYRMMMFRCSECEFSPKMRNKNERSALRSHVRAHLRDVEQFQCPLCDLKKIYRQEIRKHIHLAHPKCTEEIKILLDPTEYNKILEKKVKECFGDNA